MHKVQNIRLPVHFAVVTKHKLFLQEVATIVCFLVCSCKNLRKKLLMKN